MALATNERTDAFRELGESVTRLVGEHVELAKAELAQAAKRTGRDAALLVGACLAATLGWTLLAFAVGYGLADRMGLARGFLIVAAFHVALAGVVAGVVSRRMRRGESARLERTRHELRQDRAFLGELRRVALHKPSRAEGLP